jgi:hypothetical protein
VKTTTNMAKLYARLITVAQQPEGTIAYSAAGSLIGLDMENPADRNEISELLEEIVRAEVAEGRPMLSSVVVYKDGSGLGQGFFTLARQLGRARAGEEDYVVHARELKATYAAWRRR